MIDSICRWLNEREMVRLGIALTGGPGSSFFMTKSSGWVELGAGFTLLSLTTIFALIYGSWVAAQEPY